MVKFLLSPVFKLIVLFLLAQFLALFAGSILIENVVFYEALRTGAPEDITNVFYIFGAIIVGAIFLLIVLTLPVRDMVIKIIEFLATVVASTIVFFVILSIFYVPFADLIALALAVLLYVARVFFSKARELLAVVSAAGVGALIGFSLDPFPMIILIVAVSVYDIIAVWWTGHMVEFAKYFVKRKTAFTISAIGKTEVEVKRQGKTFKELKPISMELGTGDLSIPAALVVSIYKLGNLIFPLASIIGGALGLFLVLKRASEEKRVMPAMPSITIYSLFALFFAIAIYYVSGKL